ncbi:class I SAM-dependent methyltransferase [Fructilactobacillus sanfranciscensis]|uniref:class I SAM-dependent methyltransferase n=1 Tax=Fructilactobacillus sanfranciscensis TaxID=1625 RepID=UPI000CD3C177|nr:class I SAM-dependent methyltransferase [Fructilactobacillus sanfranciscensis]MCG7195221.1 class I SAM-dependent methyltransferase [Fructilactobacillus sanfranciscensis]MVF15552.1 class I SAM-dependent methyltransferase [Fructilactobacillus sanfranciscensis]NDR76788.1 class I SAM-dependent methyltransferase [Fructilactobacillus sanfranciscensis]NDR97704.1 class I SAM-dependent methyltransferase [Fructilactobacillus sanfranciscensis]TNK96362.1 class I SAM-dependent methyltransferase [Fructil
MSEKDTTDLYQVFDQSTTVLMQALNTSYLDAFIETADNIIDNGTVRVEDGVPNEKIVKELTELYKTVDYKKMDAPSIRRAIQMAMIRAIKVDKIQAIHQITPDTIAYIMGYLILRLYKEQKSVKVLDPAVGSENLLTAVMNQLNLELHENVSGIGIDNDDSMISIASISAKMQGLDIELIHQDSLAEMDIPDIDLVVSDLPVGYYPIDENTVGFETRASKGHSYVHHLLIEQSVKYLKEGEFAVFLVPSNLFQTNEAKGLLKWMQDTVYLQGVLNLPKELFLNESAQKAIMILQKRGNGAKQADKVMLGEFPSFKDTDAFQKFMQEVVDWEEKDLLKK